MALTNKLTAIANAIRAKTGGSSALSLDDMVTEIGSISGGSAPVIESKNITENGTYTAPSGVDGYSPIVVNIPSSFPNVTFSGNLAYLNYNGIYDWLFENYANKISIENVTEFTKGFYNSHIEDLSQLEITSGTGIMSSMFQNCVNLKKLPEIISFTCTHVQSLFDNCQRLRYINNGWENSQKFILSLGSNAPGLLFYNCFSLREIPSNLLSQIKTTSATSGVYNNMFGGCYSIDEILNLPVIKNTFTRNNFGGTFYQCHRLKRLTFETDNGTPIVANWSKQQISLANEVGYCSALSHVINYNSGITTAKAVALGYGGTVSERYELLKNDPDWCTNEMSYSRYNHDSAVETINSLPDVNSGSNNSISFKGNSGSSTDEGAVNTLTAAEIAVATNKGWTVTFA